MIARRLDPSAPPNINVALFAHRSSIGGHVGVVYRAADSAGLRCLHQAWHCDSRDEALALGDAPSVWVQPGLDAYEQAALRAYAVRVAAALPAGGLPYGFPPGPAGFGPDGSVDLGESVGLTCSTFVTRLFDAAKVPLLQEATWASNRTAERVQEDTAVQEHLVAWLARGHAPDAARQAERLKSSIGSPRIRAEEVAAASSFTNRPVDFDTVEPAGRELLDHLGLK